MGTSTLEFCITRRKAELPAFLRVLRALPEGRMDYRPDPRARTAAELAGLIVMEEAALLTLLDTGTIDWKDEPAKGSPSELAGAFERHAQTLNARLAALDAAAWQKPARFLMGGSAVWEDSTEQFFWGFLFDAVHHRGQLSTYLRPMGGKVPSIYGPSADDPGQ